MLLAEIHLWFGGFVLLTLAGLGYTVYAVGRELLRGVWRACGGRGTAGPWRELPHSGVCANPRCGHRNPPLAAFCARCGRSFGFSRELDPHG